MASGKQGNSSETISTDENDDRQEDNAAAATPSPGNTTRRSYECTFCKRGFTNAQALGGHMNIHRKDRAKTKQLTPSGSSSTSSPKPNQLDYNNMNPNFTGRVSAERPMNYYPVIETRMYFQPSSPSPSHHQQQQISHGNINQNGIQFQGHQSNEQLWGENLSLRVGSNHNLEDEIGEVSKEDELDLELRLGHDRY